MPDPKKLERNMVGLPPRTFFYTVDQIASMLELSTDYMHKTLLFYEGRSAGICPKSKMRAVNMAPEGETPEWRISENAFLGYLRFRGVKFYDRGYVL